MNVWLIGVDHRIQWIPQDLSEQWQNQLDRFRDLVESQAIEKEVDLIAEEFSKESIKVNNALDSTALQAAKNACLPHLFCDPDSAERSAETIEVDDDRENEWLKRLDSKGCQNVIFICGDNHLNSFSEKLRLLGHESRVIAKEWGKGWEMLD